MRITVLLLAGLILAAPARGQDPLSSAQALYASAQYEDALKAFDALKASGAQAPKTVLAVEQWRAFCLLALDRKADAEQAIQAILALDPFFKPAEDDTPPKIRTAFRDARRRGLAGVVQQVYQRAKAAYDRKAYDEAVSAFGQVLTLLDDPDLVLDAGPRGDMRLVAKAFEDLAKAASVPPVPSTAAPPAGPGPPAAPPASGDPGAGGVTPPAQSSPAAANTAAQSGAAAASPLYDAASKDVTPPVALRTGVTLPDSLRRSLPGGDVVVEVVVAPSGAVESAISRQAPDPVLGAIVARAVQDWRYRPATRAGAPVRYRMLVKVVMTRQ
jgi:TonB family protein